MACTPIETDGLISSKQVPGFSVRHYRFPAGWRIPHHEHRLPALVVPLTGCFRGHARRDAFEPAPGELLAVPPAAVHHEEIGPRGAAALLVTVTEGRMDSLSGSSLFEGFHRFRGPRIKLLTNKVARELRSRDPLSKLGLESALLELIVVAQRQPIPADNRRARWLSRVRDILDEHFDRPFDVSCLARRSGVSRAHLTRSFRLAYGCSIGEYVRRRRLQRATELLETSDLPLADVALTCGFYDQSHLCRHFRRHLGMTPSAWRSSS